MEVIYLLIPVALLLVAIIAVILFWAIRSGQFDDMEGPGHRIIMDNDDPIIEEKDEKDKTIDEQ